MKSSYSARKHINAVIAASASGEIAQPFFILAGKRINSEWWAPVTGSFNDEPHGIILPFTKPGWFPGDGVIEVSKNGSMEGNLLATYVRHLDAFARRFVSQEEKILLCLDGHASRKSIEWLELCVERNIECIVNAANTSHFLQPCDQLINKRFHDCMREIRDEFCRQGHVDTTKVNFNFACAVYAWRNIGTKNVTNSFNVTGLFPFKRDFAVQFKRQEEDFKACIERDIMVGGTTGPSTRSTSVKKRIADSATISEVQNIMSSSIGTSSKLEKLSNLLRNSETITAIFGF